ncbi:MAG: alpha/beta hydrolase-fold protein [candidate division Zixibacteria bacterium]|nr:alpha/beta hydrolase-fold protein [candidate division Zixibacteria bacterium]
MKRKIVLPIFLVLLFYLIFSGCARRKNPLQMTVDQGGIFEISIDTAFTLINNVLGDPFGRTLLVYLPPGYQEGVSKNYKYPVLILLHGFKENGSSYDHYYRIKTIADQMISSGEIQPMMIVMPDGSGRFGGSFFTNSVYADSSIFAGKYEDYITRELMHKTLYNFGTGIPGVNVKVNEKESIYVNITHPQIVRDTVCYQDTTRHPPCATGDSILIRYQTITRYDTITVTWIDTVTTISDSVLFQQNFGISGHGNGGYGALRIATDYPLTFGSVSVMSAPLDFDSLLNLVPAFLHRNKIDSFPERYHQIDLNNLDSLSSLFFAMAVAFSPHNPSSTNYTTFFKLTPSGKGVDLPFDSLGNTVSSIWNKWLEADLKTRILNISSSDTSLKYLKIYIDCGDPGEFGFKNQALTFYNFLPAVIKNNTTLQIYSGYPGYPALENSFIYDRLREVLKFHSDHFTAP